MLQKRYLFLLILNINLFADGILSDPMAKSILAPGWGQLNLGKNIRARNFILTEFSLLVIGLGAHVINYNQIKNYQSFSAKHAGVLIDNKDHKYWVDIGNYNNFLDYNHEHLRFREPDDLYNVDQKWYWNSEKNRKIFKRMRINSDLLKFRINFIIGGLVLNHIVSGIDALYLKRLKNSFSINLNPSLNYDKMLFELKVEF